MLTQVILLGENKTQTGNGYEGTITELSIIFNIG